MAWYKMTCKHGPGHQSSDSRFVEANNIKEAEEILDDWMSEHHYWRYPIARVERVKRFRKREKEKLLDSIESDIEYGLKKIEYKKSQIARLKARKD